MYMCYLSYIYKELGGGAFFRAGFVVFELLPKFYISKLCDFFFSFKKTVKCILAMLML